MYLLDTNVVSELRSPTGMGLALHPKKVVENS
jgi:predicted nucleic acid-binding protein